MSSFNVAVVSYRNWPDIVELIDSIEAQTLPASEVHVCENGGEEAYRKLVETIVARAGGKAAERQSQHESGVSETATITLSSGLKILAHLARSNSGYAGGVNACIRAMQSSHWQGDAWSAVWVLNPDTVPDQGAAAALSRRLGRDGCGIAGGSLVFADSGKVQAFGGVWRKWMARGLNLGFGASLADPIDGAAIERTMDYVSGACMLISRSFIEEFGLMDEEYFLYCEEVDWCMRAGREKLGFAPDAVIRHGHGSTIGSHRDRKLRSRLSVYLDERNKIIFTRKNFGAIYPIVCVVTFVLLAQYLRHMAFKNYLFALSGWFAGIRGETGIPPWFMAEKADAGAGKGASSGS